MDIALIGYGHMGQMVGRFALEEGHRIAAIIRSHNKDEMAGQGFRSAAVAIEFSQPESAPDNILACVEAGIPVVCGTTGWYEKLPALKKAIQEKGGALLYGANFSSGVNLFFLINRWLTAQMKAFPEYAASIREIHHLGKRDSPSGTAVSLAEDIVALHPAYTDWGTIGTKGILPVKSLREDAVPGFHEVAFVCGEDVIRLSHEAFNREGFARGAIRAATWLQGRKGVFPFSEVFASGFR